MKGKSRGKILLVEDEDSIRSLLFDFLSSKGFIVLQAENGGKGYQMLKAEKPDLVIFDKEENTLEMASDCPFPYLATHVRSLASLAEELQVLGEKLQEPKLLELSHRARLQLAAPSKNGALPALKTIRESDRKPAETILYMIWKNPWMAVSRDTFIGDVCSRVGVELP